jgi:hypothetical protein
VRPCACVCAFVCVHVRACVCMCVCARTTQRADGWTSTIPGAIGGGS